MNFSSLISIKRASSQVMLVLNAVVRYSRNASHVHNFLIIGIINFSVSNIEEFGR